MPDEEPDESSLRAKRALLCDAAIAIQRPDRSGVHAGLILLASAMDYPTDSMTGFGALVRMLREHWPHASIGLRTFDLSSPAFTAELTCRSGVEAQRASAFSFAGALGLAWINVELAEIDRQLAFIIPKFLRRPKPGTKPAEASIFD